LFRNAEKKIDTKKKKKTSESKERDKRKKKEKLGNSYSDNS